MDLSKAELVSKLEEISLLHKKALVVKNKMNNYQPEDNYVREIIVPQFPGDLDDDDKEYLETGINHEDEDAIEEVMESYDDYSAPRKPVEPTFESFREPHVETKGIGCLMFGGLFTVAVALMALLGGGLDSISKTASLCVLAVGAIITVISIIKGIANKAKKAHAKSKALSAYKQNKEKAMAEYKAKVQAYESDCVAYKTTRQSFLNEYTEWREIYLKSLDEEDEISEKLEADRAAAVKKIETEEFEPVLLELANTNDIVPNDYLSDLDNIIELIRSGRADDLKEAINLYEDILYRERQLQLERQKEEQRRYEAEQRRADEERRHREDMAQRESQERQRRYEEEQRHREDMAQREKMERDRRDAELERKRREDDATLRQCNSCALRGSCSIAFSRPNCASYRPR